MREEGKRRAAGGEKSRRRHGQITEELTGVARFDDTVLYSMNWKHREQEGITANSPEGTKRADSNQGRRAARNGGRQ
jgi:hypothetical protein